jgi:hypothetical protein
MLRIPRFPIILLSAMVVLILTSFFASFAFAQEGIDGQGLSNPGMPSASDATPTPVPEPGGPGFISVSPFAFTPYQAANPASFTGQMIYFGSQGTDPTIYIAPLNLPHGAIITKMVAYLLDNNSTNWLRVSLLQCPYLSTVCSGLAEVMSTYAQPENRSLSVPMNVAVDLQSNNYILSLTLPPISDQNINIGLLGVRVDYTYFGYLPAVQQ